MDRDASLFMVYVFEYVLGTTAWDEGLKNEKIHEALEQL